MTFKKSRTTLFRSVVARRAGALPAVALLLTGALVGCGSSDGSAFDEFAGSWEIDFTTSTFDLSCPAPNAALSGDQPLWVQVLFERGTLTDLVEFGGPCPAKVNVLGKVATVADPDPFTGKPPVCRLDIGEVAGTIFADITPAWEFNLLKPEKGMAPTAQLVDQVSPVSSLTVVRVVNMVETPDPACTYTPRVNLTKVAQY